MGSDDRSAVSTGGLNYRVIDRPEDEGDVLLQTRDDIARFYFHDMHGRARLDGPGAVMKFTRDWEYPWTLLRAQPAPGKRILDCGAGNSPLPYLWAARGASVVALDRDALVLSRAGYAAWCLREAARDLRASFGGAQRTSHAAEASSAATANQRPAAAPGTKRRDAPRSRWSRFAVGQFRRNRDRLGRLWKPDFWGPVSPALLDRYQVRYLHGDFTRLPFPSGSFDSVVCVSVLEHLPVDARLRGASEMARVLAPGGRLVITYDVIDGDITQALIDAARGAPQELVYFRASKLLYAPNAPDVVGVVIEKPRA